MIALKYLFYFKLPPINKQGTVHHSFDQILENCLKTLKTRGLQPLGRSPLVSHEGSTTGLRKQPENACISFIYASSGRVCTLHLHEWQVHLHAAHENGAACVCMVASRSCGTSHHPHTPQCQSAKPETLGNFDLRP